MNQLRTIKKYPNRRLYDTAESRYITLSDIRRLVASDTGFTVVEQKSGNDITRSVLLQVISEQEANGRHVMSRRFLAAIIRAYDHGAPELLAQRLEQSLAAIAQPQHPDRTPPPGSAVTRPADE